MGRARLDTRRRAPVGWGIRRRIPPGAGITGARTVKSGRLRSTISTTTASACRAAVKSSRYGTARENSASRNACAKKGSTALPKESRNISSRPVPLSFSVVMVMSSSLRKEEVYR